MKKTRCFGVLDIIAKNNNYKDKIELLQDYSFIPTVMMPNHRKFEIIRLIWKHIKNRKR